MITQANPNFSVTAQDNLLDCLQSNWITEGKYCNQALDLFKHKTKLKHAFFAPNGTLAIYLALLALDLPKGSKVIVPSFTFYGSVTPIIFAGLVPVFVDCHDHTYQMNTDEVEQVIDSSTSAIMAVDIYGRMCDTKGLRHICDEHGLHLIEDAAQAMAVYDTDGCHAGSHAHISTFSLFADKSYSTGEGGIVATNCDQLASKLALLRNQGRPNSGTFIHPSLGMNFRVTDLHGGLAVDQFNRWEEIREQRQDRWLMWASLLKNNTALKIHDIGNLEDAAPFRFAFTTQKRPEIEHILTSCNIMVRGFFHPMHLQPMLSKYSQTSCKNTEKLSETGLCLPLHQLVTDEIIETVSNQINSHG